MTAYARMAARGTQWCLAAAGLIFILWSFIAYDDIIKVHNITDVP